MMTSSSPRTNPSPRRKRVPLGLALALLMSAVPAFGPAPVSAGSGRTPPARAQGQSGARRSRVHRPPAPPKARARRPRTGEALVRHELPAERTPAQVAGYIRPGDHVFVPVGHSVASSVLRALLQRARKPGALTARRPVTMVGLTNTSSRKLFEESRGKIVPKSVFVGANSREAIARGRGEYIPVHLSRVPRLIREGSLRVDVALIQVSPPDEGGKVSLGSTAGSSLAAIEKARTVIAEINPHVPYTFGATQLPLAKIDYVVHSDKPLRTVDPPELGRTDRRIAKHILGLIPDEPTLQFGIGSTTDAVASLLADSGRNDLRIHSEMISDGTMRLMESGAVRGRAVYSFAMGSEKLLRWMHRNRRLKSQPSDVTNDPRRLAAIDRLVSINTALRVDLQGQINAQYVGDRPYSGVGGQQDFFRGAMMSEGGRAILALPSTSSVRDESGQQRLVSRIVLRLGEEDLVTSSMHDVQYVVTEYGAAHLEGKSEVGRAKELIRVAHPDFRADLRGELQQQLERRKQASHERERRASKQDEADS